MDCTISAKVAIISQSNKKWRLLLSPFNPNRSLVPERISLGCWADGWLWVRRRSGLRRERTSNKMPTRKWKMTGSYILCNKLHNNVLMTDWDSIFSIYLSLLVCWIGARNSSVNKFWKTLSRVRTPRKNTYSIWVFDIVLSDSNEGSPLASCKVSKTTKPRLLRLFCKLCF